MDETDWELDFESWEDHYDLHEQRDYPSLVALCESEVRRRANDLHAAERLVEAYMLNKEFDKAIEFAARIHRECPDISAFQHYILDALYALGKSEDDFEWIVRPNIIRLTPDFADRCYDFLRPKRNPRSIHDLTFEIGAGNYLAFTDDELLQYLRQDARFLVDGIHPATAGIKAAAKRRSRTKR